MFAYENTPLEHWIESLYIQHGITSPLDLNIFNLAEKWDIWIYFREMTSQALEINGMQTIIIDKRLSLAEQWLDFLHELCHLLRHGGNQTLMPPSLLELQEEQADQFVLYAALPHFMVKDLQLPNTENDIINLLVSEFRVTPFLAAKRLDQIKRRDYQVKSHSAFIEKIRSQYRTYDPLDRSRWSDETRRIMDQLSRQLSAKGITVNG